MTDLLSRLEVAEAGCPELDREIVVTLRPFQTYDDYQALVLTDPDASWWITGDTRVTTSLDAALALAERVLPGWDFIVGRTNGGLTIHAQVGPGKRQFGNTPALALCIAILKAKGAEQ